MLHGEMEKDIINIYKKLKLLLKFYTVQENELTIVKHK